MVQHPLLVGFAGGHGLCHRHDRDIGLLGLGLQVRRHRRHGLFVVDQYFHQMFGDLVVGGHHSVCWRIVAFGNRFLELKRRQDGQTDGSGLIEINGFRQTDRRARIAGFQVVKSFVG